VLEVIGAGAGQLCRQLRASTSGQLIGVGRRDGPVARSGLGRRGALGGGEGALLEEGIAAASAQARGLRSQLFHHLLDPERAIDARWHRVQPEQRGHRLDLEAIREFQVSIINGINARWEGRIVLRVHSQGHAALCQLTKHRGHETAGRTALLDNRSNPVRERYLLAATHTPISSANMCLRASLF